MQQMRTATWPTKDGGSQTFEMVDGVARDILEGKAAMKNDMDMGGAKVTNLGNAENDADSLPYGQAKAEFAPSGYGLGGQATIAADLNTCIDTGFNWTSSSTINVPGEMNYATVEVIRRTTTQTVQKLVGVLTNQLCKMIRVSTDGGATWTDEWENPPMKVGVEYRTTERFMGKPVYRMLFDFGTMPNKTYKTMSYYPTWDVVQPISAVGILNSGGTHTLFPTVNYSGTAGEISLKVQSNNITISASSDIDMSGKTAYVDVKYVYK